MKGNAHKVPHTHQMRGVLKTNTARKTAFRHNPIASGRAAEWHSPYDATYSSDTHVPLGPRYSPERGLPHDSWPAPLAPVARAASEEDAPRPAVQHPYPVPTAAKSAEAHDLRDVQKRTGGSFGDQKSDTDDAQPATRKPDPHKREHIDHAIDKKDLLYYMDDGHLRRNNELTAELDALGSDERAYDHSHGAHHAARNRRAGAATQPAPPAPPAQQPVQAAQPQPNVARFAAVTEARARADASVVSLTDSSSDSVNDVASGSGEARAANATYRVLRIGARHGARRAGGGRGAGGARRLLEERDAAGLTLIRLDGAPFPQFRLPHARRQYMRERRHRHHRTR